jgi:hypothetical protein
MFDIYCFFFAAKEIGCNEAFLRSRKKIAVISKLFSVTQKDCVGLAFLCGVKWLKTFGTNGYF